MFLNEFVWSLFNRKLDHGEKSDIKTSFARIWKGCVAAPCSTKSSHGSLDYEIGQWILVYLKSVFRKRVAGMDIENTVRNGILERIESVKRIMKGMDS